MVAYRVLVFVGWLLVTAAIMAPPSDADMRQGLWVKALVWIPVLLLLSLGGRREVWRRHTYAIWLFGISVILVVVNLFIDYVLFSVLLDLSRSQLTGPRYTIVSLAYLGSLIGGLLSFIALVVHAAMPDRKPSRPT